MKSTKKCVIDIILSHRQSSSGKIEYHVKWKKFPLSRATWEPFVNLAQVQDMVRSYWKKYKASQSKNWEKVELNKQCLLIYDQEMNEAEVLDKQNRDENQNTNQQEKHQNPIIVELQNKPHQNELTKHLRQKMKFTKEKSTSIQKHSKTKTVHIDFSQVKKVKAIKYNKFQQKWKVLIQFYDTKISAQKWVNRQLVRMGNPFVLLLKKTQNWEQIHELVTEVDYQ